MAKRHKKEFYLPQEIIHHIQSFLNTKESAQTSILSKSWLAAWSTRPILVFDEDDFPETMPTFDSDPHPLPILCKRTLNRYKTLNLKADKFVLKLKIHQPLLFGQLANKLIISALELHVNEIELNFDNSSRAGFRSIIRFNLPAQVFASTTLTRLSVNCKVIDVVLIGNSVYCPRLTSLVLRHISATDDVVRDILLGCPLIKNLDLQCHGLKNINVSKLLNLVKFRVRSRVRVEFTNGRNVTEFCYLRKLHFKVLSVSNNFFTKFSSMFPCIEDLTLGNCLDYQVINISSSSLRRLSLYTSSNSYRRSARGMLNDVQLNVPNIAKFVFKADIAVIENHFKPLPSLSFDNVPKDWESDVQLSFCTNNVIEACLFADLRRFLIQLTRSRISLHIAFDGAEIISSEEIPCLPSIPVVENLTVCACTECGSNALESILLGLSKSCCSNFITECKVCNGDIA